MARRIILAPDDRSCLDRLTAALALVHLAGGLNPFGICRAISVRLSWLSGSESLYPARCTSRTGGVWATGTGGRIQTVPLARRSHTNGPCHRLVVAHPSWTGVSESPVAAR